MHAQTHDHIAEVQSRPSTDFSLSVQDSVSGLATIREELQSGSDAMGSVRTSDVMSSVHSTPSGVVSDSGTSMSSESTIQYAGLHGSIDDDVYEFPPIPSWTHEATMRALYN